MVEKILDDCWLVNILDSGKGKLSESEFVLVWLSCKSIMECYKDEAIRAKQIVEGKMQKGDFSAALKIARKAQQLFPELDNVSQPQQSPRNPFIKKQHGPASNFPNGLRPLYETANAIPKAPYSHFTGSPPFQNAQEAFWTCCSTCGIRYQYCRSFVNWVLRCQICKNSFTAYDLGTQVVPPGFTWSQFPNQNVPISGIQNGFPNPGPSKVASQSIGRKLCVTKVPDKSPRLHPISNAWNAVQVDVGSKIQKKIDDFITGKEGVQMPKPDLANRKEGVRGPKPNVANGKEGAGMPKSNVGKPDESGTSRSSSKKRKRKSAEESGGSCKVGDNDEQQNVEVQENGSNLAGQNFGQSTRQQLRRSAKQKQDVSYKDNVDDDDFVSLTKRPKESEQSNSSGEEVKEAGVLGRLSNNYKSAVSAEENKRELKQKATFSVDENLPNKKTKTEKGKEMGKEAHIADHDDKKFEVNDISKVAVSPGVIEYPDADFTDFDKDKTENCFAVNQVWAIYDKWDGMPRFYARIKKVFSPGFKLWITWLEPDPDDENEIVWCDADLPVACGKFINGSCEETEELLMFSHQITLIKGVGRQYLIYPKVGETWAIFRDWDSKWSSDPEKHKPPYQFDFVEVLTDFNESAGIGVAYLGEVKGFVSLFQRIVGNGVLSVCVEPLELYRFSHRIPSVRMTGEERKGVPVGSFELDPASLPTYLHRPVDPGDVKIEKKKLETEANGSCANTPEGLSEYPDADFTDFGKDKAENCFAVNQVWAIYDAWDGMPRFYAQIKKVFSPGFKLRITWLEPDPDDENEIVWCDADLPVACGKFINWSSEETEELLMFSHQITLIKGVGRQYLIYPKVGETWAIFRDWDSKWSSDPEKHKPPYQFDFVEVLTDFNESAGIGVAYLGEVKGFVSLFQRIVGNGVLSVCVEPLELYRFSHRIPSVRMTGEERKGVPVGSFELDPASLPTYLHRPVDPGDVKIEKKKLETEANGSCANTPEGLSEYPDADFTDFDKDKTENCFAVNQVWAIYDKWDGMPRFYARIKKVFSPGFKLRITWLEPDPDDENEIVWCDADLPVACGKFINGSCEETEELLMFSHQITLIKGVGRQYLIYPKVGETWAIFRDWDSKWSSDPEKHKPPYQFDFVEVLTDFNESAGIGVAYLGVVKGFVSLFQRIVGNGVLSVCVEPLELYRFSHRIPSVRMTGEERKGVPVGSFELDPASLPTYLHRPVDPGDVKIEKKKLETEANGSCANTPEGLSEYPDADFTDFDKDKTENCFAVNQVWAIYDKWDGMPRFYARIKKVFSPGFKLRITWLEPDPDDENEIVWCDADLPVACGKFINGSCEETEELLMFSHQITLIKGVGRQYLIYPKVGETWAIFRDWDSKWSSDPEKHKPPYQFDFVEVLTDFNESAGIGVAYLGEVKGFVGLFQRIVGNGVLSVCVEPLELYRFSHRIPSVRMTGEERKGFPVGSFELDPASLPTYLHRPVDPGDVKIEKKKLETEANGSCANTPEGLSEYPDSDFTDFGKDKAENCFTVNQVWAIYDAWDGMPRFYAQIKKVFSPGFKLRITWLEPDPDDENEIVWCDADLPVACGKFINWSSEETEELLMFSHQITLIKGVGRQYLIYPKVGETWAIFRDWDSKWSSDPEKHKPPYQFDFVEVLTDFNESAGIGVAYLGEVKGFVSLFQRIVGNGALSVCVEPLELYRFSHRIPSVRMTGEERKGVPVGSFELDPASLPTYLHRPVDPGDVKIEKKKLETEANGSCANTPEGLSEYPDADFTDFDKDKTENCFAVNQVWDIYDKWDGMPRFYARIKKVFSPGFKLRITWLEPDPDDENEIVWCDADLPVACGKFINGSCEETEELLMFSHQITLIKGVGRQYLIYPKVGETWAIFRDWDSKWSSDPEKHKPPYQFDFVEVLTDFNESAGIGVAYLGEVKGFVSLFQRIVGNGVLSVCVEPLELYRFSHRIPSVRMTGEERKGVPVGSFELDPASLPTYLHRPVDPGDVKIEKKKLETEANGFCA
ncbi:hypothetical protein Pint_20644 [Pistacia integerrima]|uniref:Uncharacterized protein n=1 Tax=Pistacia integerrima TaxID=434235 RepID=A0ACC0XAW8_9ROSI|nr:hypothetical protein Pint_20644 [Pistacia integerrima]